MSKEKIIKLNGYAQWITIAIMMGAMIWNGIESRGGLKKELEFIKETMKEVKADIKETKSMIWQHILDSQ